MDGTPPQEEDFTAVPILDRLVYKNWKARVHAYESLIKTFQTTASDTDPAFRPYLSNLDLLKKIATDANAVAQEKGVECLVTLVKFAGESAAKTRPTVVPALVEKCFGSSRIGTKNQAMELTLQYVEVENGGAGVMNDLLSGLAAKQPKAVAGCIFAMKEIIRLFGIQTTPAPPVLKALPKIFSHSDKAVRAEGTLLTHAFYNYMGPAIEPWLADLKPVQIKELKEAFESMEKHGRGRGSFKPERLTRAQAREEEADELIAKSAEDQVEEDSTSLDPRTSAEPVDIVSKLPSSLYSSLASSKWKERKEALDELLTVLTSTLRIKDAPELGDLAKALAARIQGDANINCVMMSAACMEALAKGMANFFARFREVVVGHMLERLKERKANVTDAIGAALDAVFQTTSLPDILPDILPALSSKNPQAKEGALKFLSRCLSTATTPIQTLQIKPVSEALATLVEDGYEGARNEAATCLGTLMKMVGERPMNAVLEGLDDMRKAKVKEAYDKATIKCRLGAGGPRKAPIAAEVPVKQSSKKPATTKPAPKPADADEETAPQPKSTGKPPAKLLPKKPPVAATSTAQTTTAKKQVPAVVGTAKPSKAGSNQPPNALDSFKYKHTPEDAEALALDLIPPDLLKDLNDANWKTRLTSLEELHAWLEGVVDTVDAEVVVRTLARKGWNEKNFQVSAKLYGILVLLAERAPSFGRSCVALCVAHLSEKLGDLKLKKPAGDTLLIFTEKTSLQFVLNQAYEPLSKQKSPKVLADALTWVNAALVDFGITGLSLRAVIEFLKTTLQNSNAAVRTSATRTLVTLKLFAGSGIKDLLEDLNPQLLSTISNEFEKVEGAAPPEPTRISMDVANMMPSTFGKADALNDPLEDLFPRVEIDSLLKGTSILADAKSESWKSRKEALEALQTILDQGSNKRLKPNMGEIGQVLRARVTDTNKAVQTLALDLVCRIATGMGKPFEKQTKYFVAAVTTVLADQKAPIRAAAVQALTAIATGCDGVESMIHGLTTGLESSNPIQKGSLFNWILAWFKYHEPSPSLDLSAWAAPIVACLDDRNSDVRKGAQAMLPMLIRCAGFDYVLQQTNSLKPASRASAVPLIQAARPAPAAVVSLPPAPKLPDNINLVSDTNGLADSCPESPTDEDHTAPAAAVPKLTGVRRKLPSGTSQPASRAETQVEYSSRLPGKMATSLKHPGTATATAKASTSHESVSSLPFMSVNVEARKTRLAKDGTRWINEGGTTRKDLAELLQHQMEPHASKELVARLFSHDHNAVNDHILGLTSMADLFSRAESDHDIEEIKSVCLANFDLPLKYVSIKAHESQPNLISKCLDTVDAVLAFIRSINYQLTDVEAHCFIPTMIFKLGDAREQARLHVQQIIQTLPKVYPYSRVFQLLLEYGIKSRVAKTRQGTVDEMTGLLKKSGLGVCDPSKTFPLIATMISDKDTQVRKSTLTFFSEAYLLVGEKIWSLVGSLSPKDKTQLEERLRRIAEASSPTKTEVTAAPPAQVARLATSIPRSASPSSNMRSGGITRSASPSVSGITKSTRPASPGKTAKSSSPVLSNQARPVTPAAATTTPSTTNPSPPTAIGRPKTLLPSRLGRPRSNLSQLPTNHILNGITHQPALSHTFNERPPSELTRQMDDIVIPVDTEKLMVDGSTDITVTISSILSSDPVRSVDALKKIQKILSVGPEAGPSSPQYRELAEHTEGLIETITLQMAHVFDRPDDLVPDENFRLAKHLIQTLNNFCDHPFLAESLTVDILTSLLEELTLRLLETDENQVKKVKDLSRFINMIILRLFTTGRRMSIFRALFALLLRIVKPFPSNCTLPDSKEAKVAELVLKCVWKLARNIPQDLGENHLDPVELFPTIEHFLQSVPPNEWRARATNKVPCGDMPLRTIKVIIQHVVAHYGDDVYDLLSASFDDPSATIVYPYVYRILNANPRAGSEPQARQHLTSKVQTTRPASPTSSQPLSPEETASPATLAQHPVTSDHRASHSMSSANGHVPFSTIIQESDLDAQLLEIIGHISSETTGALHKEGITELHHFLKAYPHKRPRVEKMLESTGAAFRKYINRALASRAAEDQERDVVVADTLTKLESTYREPVSAPAATTKFDMSPRRMSTTENARTQEKLHRLHDIFQYRTSTVSNGQTNSPP